MIFSTLKILIVPICLFCCFFANALPLQNYLIGDFSPIEHSEFSLVPKKYSLRKIYLLKETIVSFEKMAEAAKKEKIKLYILSGFRSFQKQKYIWESKFLSKKYSSVQDKQKRVKKILEYSAIPGSSRHHWGTEIDIVFRKDMFSLENHLYEQGEGKKAYLWLHKNAKKYGFCQPYSFYGKRNSLNIKHGFLDEKWHWSYFPRARVAYQKYIANYPLFSFPPFLANKISQTYILDYVKNIDSSCM